MSRSQSIIGWTLLLGCLLSASMQISAQSTERLHSQLAEKQENSKDNTAIRITDRPQLLVSVLPDSARDGVYEQGQILLTIRVTSKQPFDALSIDFPPIENVEQIELAAPRTRRIKSYAGEGYMHERRYALFPLFPGTLQIPQSSVQGMVSSASGVETAFMEHHAGITIPVKSRPADYAGDWWMVSPNVVIQESWSKPVSDLREGDTVTRTVTLRASGVDDKRLPVIRHGTPRSVVVRELETERRTIISRTGLDGVVSTSWLLKIDALDVVYVPPVGLTYWDPLLSTQKTVAVRGHRIESLPVDSEALAEQLLAESAATRKSARYVVVGLLLFVLLPLALAAVYAFARVFTLSGDRQFSRQFLQADSATSAYKVWRQWSSAEPCNSTAQWRTLNQLIQRDTFTPSVRAEEKKTLHRKLFLRQALRCARRYRLHELRVKAYRFNEIFVGARSELRTLRGIQ